jgi:ATP adenylyltransferase/5',5'''-P-1,P-4-tetraphosphate phosphorylase II
LCRENRPPEQEHVPFGPGYEILCNPYPIFSSHFTIVSRDHTPQVIRPELGNLLDLSRELPDLVVFYNGPNCGASAPDHMHFQAGNRGFMPIEEETGSLVKLYGEAIPAIPDPAGSQPWMTGCAGSS